MNGKGPRNYTVTVMELLHKYPGMSQTTLRNMTGMKPTPLSRTLDFLRTAGYANREKRKVIFEGNRKVYVYRLAPLGEKRYDDLVKTRRYQKFMGIRD
jgi:DNA-binding MarR family transcriptional regulator